jgi:RNA polymerase sigma factor (sigma-70 family)
MCTVFNSELVVAIKPTEVKANVEAAARIFERHGDFIYNIIRYKTTDKALVDDLFQDFFLWLTANPVSLEGPELKAFLYRAIVNDIRDAGRRVKRYRNLLNKYTENCNFSVNDSPPKNAYSAEERVETIMKNVWDELSPKETNAISLRYLEGCSIAEVANKMRVKKASVSRYICVGLKKMRRCLGRGVKDNT